jgi:hypothetical protein
MLDCMIFYNYCESKIDHCHAQASRFSLIEFFASISSKPRAPNKA